MKIAPFTNAGGTKETGEVVLILSKEEARALVKIAEETKPRTGVRKRLIQEIQEIPIF